MALDFPQNPTVGQTYSYGGKSWSWSGSIWAPVTAPINAWDALKTPAISSGALTLDLATPAGFRVALNQNVATLNFANLPSGRVVVFTITWVQDATGGRTVAFPANVYADGGGAPIQPAAGANAVTVQTFYTDNGGATIWQAGGDGLAIGQIWQNVTGSRAYNVTYVNSSRKPIQVTAFGGPASQNNTGLILNVSGVDMYGPYVTQGGYTATATAIVPPGGNYSVRQANGAAQLLSWSELR